MPSLDQQPLTKSMWGSLLVSVSGGLILTTSWFLDWPAVMLAVAALVWLAGLCAFGVLTYQHARRHDAGFWSSLGRAARQVLRAFWELLP